MKRFTQWAILLIAGLTLFIVAAVFMWQNAMNIVAVTTMFCLFVVILRQAQDLGILE